MDNTFQLLNSTKNFSKDIGEALKWLTSSDYIHLADKYQSLSSYTTKLLYYVLDVIITEHNVEEGESIKALERMVSDIVSKVPLSQKSRCRLAQLYYDLAERMLLMGSMTKALEYERQGLKYRKSLLFECFILNECTGYMNPLVAARVWSIRFEDFILAPNYNFICFLSSIYQKATILGYWSDTKVLTETKRGKTFSLHRCLHSMCHIFKLSM
ncbi:hypothetical protein Tco_0638389 [Tanacetum coccineum]